MLTLESYDEHEKHLPTAGKFIIAQFDKDSVIVYQAFKDTIAQYAVKHQKFGGDDYDFERTTWLKPSFLWMMYYSGWAKKQDQENVLAIRINKDGFDQMLCHAVLSPQQAANGDVQVQWESYHDLYGNKTERKAVKMGLKGDMLQRYNKEWILEIKNVTPFVQEQQQLVLKNHIKDVQLPRERAYAPDDLNILKKIDATTISL